MLRVVVLCATLAVLLFCGWVVRLALALAVAVLYWWLASDPLVVNRAEYLKQKNKRGVANERWAADKVPDNIDAIVIGAGMSGLTCAGVLARLGKRVLVLEQHTVAGGGTHMFDLKRYYKFDSGLHYVVPYCQHLLHAVTGGNAAPMKFDLLGEADGTYDKIVLGNPQSATPEFRIKHKEGHMAALYAKFPEEKANLDRFIAITNSLLKRFPLWALSKAFPMGVQKWIARTFLKDFFHFMGQTVEEAIPMFTGNKHLQAILASLWIDTGSPPARATFMLNTAVFRGMPQEGGAYPAGGSDEMARCLIPVIERAGGRVLERASVSEIMTSDAKQPTVTGVRMEDGTVINCPLVISSVGYHNTFGKLVAADVCQTLSIPRQLSVRDSAGFVMCNIGIHGNPEELGLTCCNLWYHPVANPANDAECDLFEGARRFFDDPLNQDFPAMITFPSLKDRAWKHPDRITCQMLVMAEYEWFEEWAGQESGARDQNYMKVKEQWQKRCLDLLFRFYPQLKGKIEMVDVSTPLSIEYYLREPRGGAVGLDQSPDRFTDWKVIEHLDMKSRVPGLWLTGQDTLLCGQPIVQIAGILTALRLSGFYGAGRFIGMCIRSALQTLLMPAKDQPAPATAAASSSKSD